MIHTENIEKAIHKASLLHKTQLRKGEDELPYITHLFSVFVILAGHTKDEDVLIAGLLHDTLEDTSYTREELERDFGSRVKDIVLGVTEPKELNGEKLAWSDRKRAYIKGLENGSRESAMVSAADKIHNFTSILRDYKESKEAFKKDFSSQDRIRFYNKVVEVVTEKVGTEESLSQELMAVFSKYKTFVESL